MTAATTDNNARRNLGNRHTRRWLPGLGGLALLALIVAGLWPKPVPVETAVAATGPLRATVNEDGKTRIRQRYRICAPVAGQLRRIPYKAGEPVVAGQTVLAVVEPLSPALLDARAKSLAEAARDSAAANLARAQAEHTFATNELRRFEKLFAEKTVSVRELEAAQMREAADARAADAAEGALRQAEAELAEFTPSANATTNTPAQPIEVKAAVNGRVLRVFEESARVVTAGTPLVEVGDPADLEVVIEVLSRDGATISPGAKVEFEHWAGPGQAPLLGRVRLVEPAAFTKISALGVEEQRVNVIADLLTPPDQRASVGDNFRVEARIITWETDQALKIPAGALFRQGDQWSAFVISGGQAMLRPVKVGRSNGAETQILEGLQPGETVILYPGSRVHPAQRVKPIKI
jgi:HlyD family secretion protein